MMCKQYVCPNSVELTNAKKTYKTNSFYRYEKQALRWKQILGYIGIKREAIDEALLQKTG